MRDHLWLLLGIVAAVGAAGVAIFGSVGLKGVDSTLATTLRAVIMAAMLVGVVAVTGRLAPLWHNTSGIHTREWVFITLAAVSGAISWLAYFAALQLGMAGPVSAVDRLSVALVFLLSVLLLGESYRWWGWLGLTLIVTGIYLVVTAAVKK